MLTWLEAATYCEETFGVPMNTYEGWFVCPECGEMLHEHDYEGYHWQACPVCDFDFFYGEE